MLKQDTIAGLIIAGGRSRRFGGVDKSWVQWQQKPLIEWIIEHASTQLLPYTSTHHLTHGTLPKISISSNGSAARIAKLSPFNLPILCDNEYPQQGPMSGILSGLQWARSLGYQWLISFPVDTPNLPNNLVENLYAKACNNKVNWVMASDIQHKQYALGLWSVNLIDTIRMGLSQQHNKIRLCLQHEAHSVALFENHRFYNINNQEELDLLNRQRDHN